MRKMFILLLVLPLFGLAQTKNLINASRYFPKSGKWQAFEKALSAHAKKYHKADYAWRVFTIETGPDAGGYMVVEGPNNWSSVDTRGDLGAAHTADWENTVQIHLENRLSSIYLQFMPDMSTAPLMQYADKISIQHILPNPGYRDDVMQNIMAAKKMWEGDGLMVAVYEIVLSGKPEFTIVNRYVNGLKKRDEVNPVPYAERFNKNNGAGSYEKWVKVNQVALKETWTELLTAKKELGSN